MLDPSVPEHPKVIALAARLKITEATALGHVVTLWCHAMRLAEAGILTGWTKETISRHAGYTGDSRRLVKTLLSVGFIERLKDGTFKLHDWLDHQGDMIAKRVYERDKKRRQRDAMSQGSPEGVPGDNGDSPREPQRDSLPLSPSPLPSLPVPSLPFPSIPIPTKPEEGNTPIDVLDEELRKAGGTNRSDRIGLLVAAWNGNRNGAPISDAKGRQKVQFALDAGAKYEEIEQRFHNAPSCKGKKIWDVLEELTPRKAGSNGKPRNATGTYSLAPGELTRRHEEGARRFDDEGGRAVGPKI